MVIETKEIDLLKPVRLVANSKFISKRDHDPYSKIKKLLFSRITSIPPTDESSRLTVNVWRDESILRFGNHEIREGKPDFLIAEIENNTTEVLILLSV